MDLNSYSRLIKKNGQYAIVEAYVDSDSVQHFQDFKKDIAVIKCPMKNINYNFEIKDKLPMTSTDGPDKNPISPQDTTPDVSLRGQK